MSSHPPLLDVMGEQLFASQRSHRVVISESESRLVNHRLGDFPPFFPLYRSWEYEPNPVMSSLSPREYIPSFPINIRVTALSLFFLVLHLLFLDLSMYRTADRFFQMPLLLAVIPVGLHQTLPFPPFCKIFLEIFLVLFF